MTEELHSSTGMGEHLSAETPDLEQMVRDLVERFGQSALVVCADRLLAAERMRARYEPLAIEPYRKELLDWAISRWNDEVKHRPPHNIHRRTLDDTWRQVIRRLGGTDVELIGPAHDDLQREAS